MNRGACTLLALLMGGACSIEIIQLQGRPPDDGGGDPPEDARSDGAPDGPPDDAMAGSGSSCPEFVDQGLTQCAPPVSQCDAHTVASDRQVVAQVFTPVLSGDVTRLRLLMRTSDSLNSRAVVSIADLQQDRDRLLDPTYSIEDHLLATTTITLTEQPLWHHVVFSSPARVIAGRPYAIYLSAVSRVPGLAPDALWLTYNDWQRPTSDVYRGGGAFSGMRNGTWHAEPLWTDRMFEVYVAPSVCE